MHKPAYTILVATSDEQLSKNLSSILSNLDSKVIFAGDGIEALYFAEKSKAAVVLLDSDIPKISSEEVVVFIKKNPGLQNVHVFMLHPKNYSFELNGIVDAYIEKPVNGKTLLSKIKTITIQPPMQPVSISNLKKIVGDLVVDRDTYMVYYKDNEILLPRKEFELIYLLASRPEKVFTREEIFKHIWHKEITPKEGRTIDVHIRKLRTKLSESLIVTIKGIGYKIVA